MSTNRYYVLEKCYGPDNYSYVKFARSKQTLIKIIKRYRESSVLFRILTYPSFYSRDYDNPLDRCSRVVYYRYGEKL